jgi:hypothetical protein
VAEWRSGEASPEERFETVCQMEAGEDFAVRALEMGGARLELQNQLYHAGQ